MDKTIVNYGIILLCCVGSKIRFLDLKPTFAFEKGLFFLNNGK